MMQQIYVVTLWFLLYGFHYFQPQLHHGYVASQDGSVYFIFVKLKIQL